MLRGLATAVILLFFALDLALPATPVGVRGHEARVRAAVPQASTWLGHPLPSLSFEDLQGREVHLADLRGHPLLVTFERSVDW